MRPLESDWRSTLDDVARSRGLPTSRDVARLGAHVADLSSAYNDPSRARASMRDAAAARLGFSFPRDVPKGAAAVRELVALGAIRSSATVRVLDVGAGLGAMTWGLVRAIEAANLEAVTVEALWLDPDIAALETGLAIARARVGAGRVPLTVRTLSRSVDALEGLGAFDLVLLGTVLSELDVSAPDAVRLDRHVTLCITFSRRGSREAERL